MRSAVTVAAESAYEARPIRTARSGSRKYLRVSAADGGAVVGTADAAVEHDRLARLRVEAVVRRERRALALERHAALEDDDPALRTLARLDVEAEMV